MSATAMIIPNRMIMTEMVIVVIETMPFEVGLRFTHPLVRLRRVCQRLSARVPGFDFRVIRFFTKARTISLHDVESERLCIHIIKTSHISLPS